MSEEKTEKTDEKQTDKPWLFKKGESGNPNGRPKGSVSVVSAIKKKLQECPEGKKNTYLHYLVEKIFKKAVIDDDTAMIKDIIDRVDGKPKQPLVGGDDDDPAIKFKQIYGGESVPKHQSNEKDIPIAEENQSSIGGNISK